MIRKERVCDICGQRIAEHGRHEIKIKEKRKICFWDRDYWVKYDICEDCQEKMVGWIKEKKHDN